MSDEEKKNSEQVRAGVTARTGRLLPPPVGTSDWARFSRTSYCVDKTLILKDLIDAESTVVLFTRPRRFGKTTALEMIRAFYEGEASLFHDKKRWAAGEVYRKEQGTHPVIFLSFKDIKQTTAEAAFARLAAVIGDEVARFADCIENGWGNGAKKRSLCKVMNREGTKDELSESLGLLSEAVHAFTKKLPVILIDEYDQPITSASTHGYYDEMCTFMRVFLSGALKDNKHCHIGIMTGVLRVAKEGILSGLNNPWTVFEQKYSQYFGFTEDEVAEMARYYGAEDKMPEIKSWYDGYDFGGTEIYNPWSVLRYFQCNCKPDAYWLDTSSNDLISAIVRDLPHDMVRTLEALLQDETPRVQMAKELGPYKDVMANKSSLYALLVSAGYLKIASPIEEGMCKVALPNRRRSTRRWPSGRATSSGRFSTATPTPSARRSPRSCWRASATSTRRRRVSSTGSRSASSRSSGSGSGSSRTSSPARDASTSPSSRSSSRSRRSSSRSRRRIPPRTISRPLRATPAPRLTERSTTRPSAPRASRTSRRSASPTSRTRSNSARSCPSEPDFNVRFRKIFR